MASNIIYNIPFPYEQFTDTKFFITHQGSRLFIPDDYYTRINDYQIQFEENNKIGITHESDIEFTFIHDKNKRWIGKFEYHFPIEYTGQKEFYLPKSPYNQLVNLNKRVYVFYNRYRQTQGLHYYIDDYNGRIVLTNRKLRSLIGERVDVLIIYSYWNANGIIQELPESGYISLSKYEIDRNYNPNLMAVFVNGKLIDKENILQMTNTLYKIDKDIKSRYNIEAKNLSPKINSMVPFYKQHCRDQEEKYTIEKNLYCRIDIPSIMPKGRNFLTPQFSPIYFFPDLIKDPELWINLILRKSSVNYDLKLFGNDTDEDPININVIMQLRLRTQREFIKNSDTASIICIIPGHIENNKEDTVLVSIQVKTIIEMDTTRENCSIDGVIGRFQANIRQFNQMNPIFYTFSSDGFDYKTEVNLFAWSVSTGEDNTGEILWKQELNLEPDNKLKLLEGS